MFCLSAKLMKVVVFIFGFVSAESLMLESSSVVGSSTCARSERSPSWKSSKITSSSTTATPTSPWSAAICLSRAARRDCYLNRHRTHRAEWRRRRHLQKMTSVVKRLTSYATMWQRSVVVSPPVVARLFRNWSRRLWICCPAVGRQRLVCSCQIVAAVATPWDRRQMGRQQQTAVVIRRGESGKLPVKLWCPYTAARSSWLCVLLLPLHNSVALSLQIENYSDSVAHPTD